MVTDKLSERAEQLARDILGHDFGSYADCLIAAEDLAQLILASYESLLREQVDSANLARGMAIEQAARLAQEVSAYNIINREYDSARSIVQEIRSLASTDAAQALKAHDAEIERRSREDEAKKHHVFQWGTEHICRPELESCQRIAALTESQPALATPNMQGNWILPAPAKTCSQVSPEMGSNQRTNDYFLRPPQERGISEQPAPAKEDSK